MLNGDHPTGGEGSPFAGAFDFEQHRRLRIARPDEIGLERVAGPSRYGAIGCRQGLSDDLPTIDAFVVALGQWGFAAEQIYLDRLKVERVEHAL